jgi:uncharacterized membrane protein YccF (DUF307 family)
MRLTIPFGIAAFRIAGYALWPFGRSVVMRATLPLGVQIVPSDEMYPGYH